MGRCEGSLVGVWVGNEPVSDELMMVEIKELSVRESTQWGPAQSRVPLVTVPPMIAPRWVSNDARVDTGEEKAEPQPSLQGWEGEVGNRGDSAQIGGRGRQSGPPMYQ
jgi:hypothetical protein